MASRWRIFGAHAGVAIASLVLVAWVMQLWRADLQVPFGYRGSDSFFHFMQAKCILDTGWYLRSPFLGMPTGMDFYDFPLTENLHFLLMKLLAVFTPDFGLLVNVYYLITFPLCAATALLVFRHFGVSLLPAALASILFAFLPYHFWRGQEHIFLATYYPVPLAVLVVLWVSGEGAIPREGEPRAPDGPTWPMASAVAGVVLCLLVGFASGYYAAFAAFLLLTAGAIQAVKTRRLRPLGLALGLVLAVSIGLLANVAPNLSYMWSHGKNPAAADRDALEAELYGLKIIQLLLPVRGHRVPVFAGLTEKYYVQRTLINENQSAGLGIIGSVGFLVLLTWPVWGWRAGPHAGLLGSLSRLTFASVLLATIGGFGAIFSLLVSTQIRAYNRMSVYIGFFSLFAVALLLDMLRRRLGASRVGGALFGTLMALLLIVGVLDQVSPRFAPPYEGLKADFANDRAFVGMVEAVLPTQAMVFQLPYVPFPENWPPVNKLPDFHLLRGYLHSTTLRWSYGAMKGRAGDAWQRQIAARPLEEMVEALAVAGFSGIYLDRLGFADGGKEVEAQLARSLRAAPIVSANGRLVFFSLLGLTKELRERYGRETWELKRKEILPPMGVS